MIALCLLPESTEQPVVDASAGVGDEASLGLTNSIRDAMGTNGVVDKCSDWYLGGEIGGALLDIGILATPEVTGAAGYWAEVFAARYPGIANFLVRHADNINKLSQPARFFAKWIARHIGG